MSDETTPGPDLWAQLERITADVRLGDLLASEIRDLFEPELDRLTRERDLAIAHDTQPYPTASAYEQACKALHVHRERADQAEAERDRLDVRMEEIVEGFKNAHNCHRTDQAGILCTTCHTRYPCPTARALDAIGDQASDVVAERDQLEAAVARVKALAEDMRTWCSPHGIAVTYAQRIDEAIEPPAPDGIEADSETEFAAQLGAIMRKHRAEVHPEHAEACANCAVIKGAPEVLTAGLDDLPAVREFAAEHDPRDEQR